MFWIALELSIPKTGLNITLSLTVKKLDAFKIDGVAESGNTVWDRSSNWDHLSRLFCQIPLRGWARQEQVAPFRFPALRTRSRPETVLFLTLVSFLQNYLLPRVGTDPHVLTNDLKRPGFDTHQVLYSIGSSIPFDDLLWPNLTSLTKPNPSHNGNETPVLRSSIPVLGVELKRR